MELKKIIKVSLAVLLLAVLIWKVGVADIWLQFSQITAWSIVYLLYISVVLLYISALKWKLFLEVFSESISTLKLTALYLVGYFVNLILPSYVGGDAVRSWQIGKKVGQHQALAATVLERYTGIVAMLSLAFVFIWLLKSVTLEIKIAVVVIVAGLVLGTIFVLSPWFTAFLKKLKVPEKIVSHFIRLKEALHFARSHKGVFIKALLLSLLYHSVAAGNVMAAAYAVGWKDVPFFDLFAVLPLVLLIGALPITPSGLGLQEGAYYFFLQGVGATPGEATAVALILRAKSYILALLGGVVWFFIGKGQKVSSSASK